MDLLLLELAKWRFGCHIGSRCCGSFGYADDVCILARSHIAIQSMLNVCQKSQLLLFSCPINIKGVELNTILVRTVTMIP